MRFRIHSSSFPQDQSHYLISLSLTVKAGSLILVFIKELSLGFVWKLKVIVWYRISGPSEHDWSWLTWSMSGWPSGLRYSSWLHLSALVTHSSALTDTVSALRTVRTVNEEAVLLTAARWSWGLIPRSCP